jgi:hypothetical protein
MDWLEGAINALLAKTTRYFKLADDPRIAPRGKNNNEAGHFE